MDSMFKVGDEVIITAAYPRYGVIRGFNTGSRCLVDLIGSEDQIRLADIEKPIVSWWVDAGDITLVSKYKEIPSWRMEHGKRIKQVRNKVS